MSLWRFLPGIRLLIRVCEFIEMFEENEHYLWHVFFFFFGCTRRIVCTATWFGNLIRKFQTKRRITLRKKKRKFESRIRVEIRIVFLRIYVAIFRCLRYSTRKKANFSAKKKRKKVVVRDKVFSFKIGDILFGAVAKKKEKRWQK